MGRRRRKPLPAEPVTTLIDGLSHEGRGIARVNDKVVFVDGALAGETVKFRYTALRGRHDEGAAVKVLAAAPERAEPRCRHYGTCGGCSLQHMSLAAQLAFKQDALLEQLRHLGEVAPEQLLPPLQGTQWGYRRKARLGVRYVFKKEKLLVGFREKQSRYLADLSHCETLVPEVGHRIEALAALISQFSNREQVAQVECASGDNATAMVFRHLAPFTASDIALLGDFAEQTGIQVYLQPKGPDSITPLRDGYAPLHYRIGDDAISIEFLPADFFQVNADINRQMVERAIDELQLAATHRVLDLFCGLGNFSLPLARRVASVVGVEGDEGLVTRARANASRNAIDNAEFHSADLFERSDDAPWWGQRYDRLLLDPPRSGAQRICESLAEPFPERIVYVSCNPATLARDAGILVRQKGYRLLKAGIMDMFPHTAHVESIGVFVRP